MTDDEWHLDWEDEPTPRRHRRSSQSKKARSRKGRKRSRGRGAKTAIALIMSLALIGALGGVAWYGLDRVQELFVTPDYSGGGTGAVEIQVLDGQTSADIAATLKDKDVVKSEKAFTEAAKKDPRSLTIAPGFYQMRLQMRASDALQLLLDPASRVTNRLTIPEGKMTLEVYALLSERTGIPVEEFVAVAKDPVALGIPESWFTRSDGKDSARGVEGFLFPATYELPRDATAADLLSMMVEKFMAVAEELNFVQKASAERHISPYEVLIAASIAQVEAPKLADMAKVTRVLYNRLYGSNFPTRRLEIDSSVNYWLRLEGKDPKASQDLKLSEMHNKDNPYNTYDVAGWTVGPISNPGEGAITAALNPDPDTSILYWVTIDKEGNTAFSKSYTEHEDNCDIARRNGAL